MSCRAWPFALVAVFLCLSSAVAQEARSPFGEGTHAFRRILFDAKLQPLAGPDDLKDPARTIVVMLGYPTFGHFEDLNWARKFVEEGGALLVATDRPCASPLDECFGVGIKGDLVHLARSRDGYQGKSECMPVEALPRSEPPLFRPPVVPGRDKPPPVIANLPSVLWFNNQSSQLTRLAVLSDNLAYAGWAPYGRVFAASGEYGDGRVLILADHSVFINDMMLRVDTGNLDFAYRTVAWLKGDGRDRVLFYDDGVARTDLEVPLKELPPPPLPPPEALLPLVGQAMHGLEKENQFNRMLMHFMDQEDVWLGVAITASVLLSLYGFVRLGLFRHRFDPASRPFSWWLASNPQAANATAQRQQELLSAGNLHEAARGLARGVFVDAGLDGPTSPVVEASGWWWRRRVWRRRVARLWRLAFGPAVHVAPNQLLALTADAEQVRRALADGTVRLRVS